MGLDIALGILTLLGGIRGWFKGFALQAVQLVALVGCVYAASPLRDLSRPYARDYLPGIQPEVLDKLLWWSAAILCYVVASGFGSSLIRLHRRKTYVEQEPNRGDQGAGFFLGVCKAAVIAVFVAAGIQSYAPQYIKAGGWVGEQVSTSRALALTEQHKPAEKIWNAPPVQAFVAHIRHEGLGEKLPEIKPPEPSELLEQAITSNSTLQNLAPSLEPAVSEPGNTPSTASADDARRPLQIPKPPSLDPNSPRFLNDIDKTLRAEGFVPLPSMKQR